MPRRGHSPFSSHLMKEKYPMPPGNRSDLSFHRIWQTWWPAAMLLLSLAALHCGGGPTAESGTSAEELSLFPSNPQSAQGTAQQFTLRSLSPSGHLRDRTHQAKWNVAVEGESPRLMPADGLLQLAEPGRYQVTAEYGDQKLVTVLTVTAATLTSLAIRPSASRLAKGLSQPFTAIAGFSDGTTQDVTKLSAWSVRDVMGRGVVIINAVGVATAKNLGKASVSVRYKTSSASTSLEVTPATLLTFSVSPSNPTIAKGSSQPFRASGTYSDGSVHDVTSEARWVVFDLVGSGVAAIDRVGVAAGQAVGQATVNAAYGGQVVRTRLTVTAATVVSLAVSPSAATLAKGTTKPFVATATFTDGSRQEVTAAGSWTATDVMGTGVASVDSTGLATGTAVGTANIACSYRGRSSSAMLQVTPAGTSGGSCSSDGWCWRNPLPQGNLLGATWGSDANNVWAVGDSGTILKWNGTAWAAQVSGTTRYLTGIWGSDANNVWAVSRTGTILKWNGTAWAAQESGTEQDLSGVWGSDANNVWAVGVTGTILQYGP